MIARAQQGASAMPRPIETEDMTAVATLWHAAWHEAHARHLPVKISAQRDLQSFQSRLSTMVSVTYVIGPLGAPVGLCAIAKDELDQLYVAPAGRGSGVAAALLGNGERRLRQTGCRRAHLFCLPQNKTAMAFYTKHDWTQTGVQDTVLPALTAQVKVARLEKDLA